MKADILEDAWQLPLAYVIVAAQGSLKLLVARIAAELVKMLLSVPEGKSVSLLSPYPSHIKR
jgi:hypothetical protein